VKYLPTSHPEVIRIIPDLHCDRRGFFLESYREKEFRKAGINYTFVQDNHSSSQGTTLRGLHYQVTRPQGKLVRVVIGTVFDVAVDLRISSPYFGHWSGATLSDENKEMMWVPPGFAHGFYVLSSRADLIYKATDYYDPEGERCIRYDDPDLAIKWPIPENVTPIISKRDLMGLSLKEAEVFS